MKTENSHFKNSLRSWNQAKPLSMRIVHYSCTPNPNPNPTPDSNPDPNPNPDWRIVHFSFIRELSDLKMMKRTLFQSRWTYLELILNLSWTYLELILNEKDSISIKVNLSWTYLELILNEKDSISIKAIYLTSTLTLTLTLNLTPPPHTHTIKAIYLTSTLTLTPAHQGISHDRITRDCVNWKGKEHIPKETHIIPTLTLILILILILILTLILTANWRWVTDMQIRLCELLYKKKLEILKRFRDLDDEDGRRDGEFTIGHFKP